MLAAFGAEVITEKGDVNVRSDNVRQVLEYAQQLVKFLPEDAVSYDDGIKQVQDWAEDELAGFVR